MLIGYATFVTYCREVSLREGGIGVRGGWEVLLRSVTGLKTKLFRCLMVLPAWRTPACVRKMQYHTVMDEVRLISMIAWLNWEL